MANAVVIGKPVSSAVAAEVLATKAPVPEFMAIAESAKATTISSVDLQSRVLRKLLAKRPNLAAAVAAFQHRSSIQAMYVTGEDISLLLIALMTLVGWKGKVFSLVHAANSKKRQIIIKLLGTSRVGAYLTVSSFQRDILITNCGVPEEKARFFYNWVDCDFFVNRTLEIENQDEFIFSCGLENRDYSTLIDAARISRRSFVVQAYGFFGGLSADTAHLPSNIRVNTTKLPFEALRDLYSRCSIVVVPLNSVDYAAGVTGLVEAMAMGKAVIITNSPGISDYFDAESLISIPPGRPDILSETIEHLLSDKVRLEELGRKNRLWIESHASLSIYVQTIASLMLDLQLDASTNHSIANAAPVTPASPV